MIPISSYRPHSWETVITVCMDIDKIHVSVAVQHVQHNNCMFNMLTNELHTPSDTRIDKRCKEERERERVVIGSLQVSLSV